MAWLGKMTGAARRGAPDTGSTPRTPKSVRGLAEAASGDADYSSGKPRSRMRGASSLTHRSRSSGARRTPPPKARNLRMMGSRDVAQEGGVPRGATMMEFGSEEVVEAMAEEAAAMVSPKDTSRELNNSGIEEDMWRPGSTRGRFRRRSIDVCPEGNSVGRASLASLGEMMNNLIQGGMSDTILPESDMRTIASNVPSYRKGNKVELVFSSTTDRFNLKNFYKRVSKFESTILVVRDTLGHVFGCFCHDPWEPFSGYFGTDECFVFCSRNGPLSVYHSSGKNTYYQLARRDHLAVGGGTSFAFFLYNDLKSGNSRKSETFNNPPLAGRQGESHFECDVVEVWRLVR